MTKKHDTSAQHPALLGIHRAVPIILFAVAVFTMFCYIKQDSGALGHIISTIFLGLFSYGAYAIPPLLAIHAIFYLSDIRHKRVLSRVIFSLIAITFISALAYSITYWNEGFTFNAVAFFKNGQATVGGGFIGGVVGFCIIKLVGKVGLVIIAAAILAIYVSYFFSGGQRGLSRVWYGILHAILVILAKIEKLVLGTHRKMSNAKTEKIKKNADLKNLELTDDEFFDVDNGMKKLRVSALGIDVSRDDSDVNTNTTLHEKIFHKSAVSKEEAEEMDLRDRQEETYYNTIDDDYDTEEPVITRNRHMSDIDYDDFEFDDETTVQLEFAQSGTVLNDTESFLKHDESADSIFTKDFDPYSMAMSEKLASKPSSKSMLDEQPRRTTVKEDIHELTEEEIEREKRVLEFERRKAAIIKAHNPTPVNNDGEFKGTPKNVDFRERKDETVGVPPTETASTSFVVNKNERVFEAPKAEPANYTSIGFSDDGDSFSTVVNKSGFSTEQTVYSHTSKAESDFSPREPKYNYDNGYQEPKYNYDKGYQEPKYNYGNNYQEPKQTYGNGYNDSAVRKDSFAPSYTEDRETHFVNNKAADRGYTVYSGAGNPNPRIYDKPETKPEAESVASSYTPYNMDHSDDTVFPFSTVKNYPNNEESAYGQSTVGNTSFSPERTEDASPFTKANVNNVSLGQDQSDRTANGYGVTPPTYSTDRATTPPVSGASSYSHEADTKEFVPEFKPYQATTEEDVSAKEVNVIQLDGGDDEPTKSIQIERERVVDDIPEEIYSGLDEDDDSLYDGLDDGEDETLDSVSDSDVPEDDGDTYEEEDIPPEEQNPVVQGYKDMFTALHKDMPEEDEAEVSTPDNSYTDNTVGYGEDDYGEDDYDENDYDENDYDEDDDEPPFDHTDVKVNTPHEPQKKAEPEKKKADFSNYKMPPIDLLGLDPEQEDDTSEINENTKILIDTLASFKVTASIKGVDRGPRITRYEVVPARGVKVNSITKLFNDIKLALASEGVRMEAPIPGKSAIGFEIPNRKPKTVRLRELIENDEFMSSKRSNTFVAIGKDVAGNPIYGDVCKYPHALICGATGMGKSVCINSIMMSILYRAHPDDVKFIMIDPKKVEFRMYSGIPHLLIPVITESKQAAGALMWAVEEMERRYDLIEEMNVRNIDAYNEKVSFDPSIGKPMSKIIIVIDELADLMIQVRDPVENLIMRIAQKARAAGIHLLIGTQRPSTNIITGTIKANIPSRISCKVTSYTDSMTVFGSKGAEELLDRGDMLYWPVDRTAALRVQGAFVTDKEVEDITKFLKDQVNGAIYDDEVFNEINKAAQKCGNKKSGGGAIDDVDTDSGEECGYYRDQQFLDAVELAIRSKKVSTSLLQRKLSIGYGKAAKFIDAMEEIGVVSEPRGQKPREVLLTMDDWHEKLSRVNYN